MQDPNSNDYDRLTPFYDLLGRVVYFGAIRRSQREFLSRIPKNSHILFIGGGTGFLLNDLLEIAQPAHVLYIEKSGRMIEKSRKNATHRESSRIEFLHGTQEDIPPGKQFDVVLTFFFFDQFSFMPLVRILDHLDLHLRPGGRWLWADFIPPENAWQRFLMRTMLVFFTVTTSLSAKRVYNIAAVLARKKMVLTEEKYFYGGFIRSAVFSKPGV